MSADGHEKYSSATIILGQKSRNVGCGRLFGNFRDLHLPRVQILLQLVLFLNVQNCSMPIISVIRRGKGSPTPNSNYNRVKVLAIIGISNGTMAIIGIIRGEANGHPPPS